MREPVKIALACRFPQVLLNNRPPLYERQVEFAASIRESEGYVRGIGKRLIAYATGPWLVPELRQDFEKRIY
jgi:hypothetical protein